MSTTFEWRDSARMQRRDEPSSSPRPRTRERAGAPGEPIALQRPAVERRSGQPVSRAVAVRLRQRLNRARFVGATIVALSILGLLYLTQISHVARYGYHLSDIQRQQVRTERENQLLEHEISGAHNLNQVNDLAAKTYGMQPLVRLTPGTTGAGLSGAPSAGAKGTPQARYITVQRPAASAPTPPPAPARSSLADRLGRHLIGIGVARAER